MATAATVVLVIGAVTWVLGPGGPMLVAQLANGRAVWRLGDLTLEGVKGGSLGDLRAARATLRDANGVWAEARDITLGWDPLRALFGVVTIREATAGSLRVFRQPHLTAPRPPGRSIGVDLSGLAIARIDVDDAVFGQAAAFSLTGGITARGAHIAAATADLKRLDAAGDTMTLDFTRVGDVRLNLNLDSPEGGFFAAALDTTAPVRVKATASGDQDAGEGVIDATVGNAELATGAVSWTKDRWKAGAEIGLSVAPAFADLTRAVGETVRLDGEGDRASGRAFTATMKAPYAGLDVSGRLGDDFSPDGPLQVIAHADRLDTFTPGVGGGGARFAGTMTRQGDVTTFDGAIEGAGVDTADIRTTFNGPARVRLTRALVDVDANVAITNAAGLPAVTRLLRNGRLDFAGRLDRAAQRFTVREARLASPQADVTATGVLGDGAPGLKGAWRIIRLDAVDPQINGGGDGRWTLVGGFNDKPFIIDVGGSARRFTTTLEPLDQLLGASPAVDAQFAIADGVVDVRRLTVTAPKLRFGAVGQLRGGVASLKLEASAQGPVRVGAAAFDGVADSTGTLEGRLDNPTLTTETRMSRIDVAGLVIDAPVVTLAFAPTPAGREGRIDIVGSAAGEAATAHALIAADDNGLAFSNLQIAVAGFTAQGDAAFSHAGPSINVTFAGAVDKIAAPLQGRARGAFILKPGANGEPVLNAGAHLVQGRIGAFTLSRVDVRARGPLDQVALEASLRGAASGADVSFDATGAFARSRDTLRLTLAGDGIIAGTPVATRTPFEARFGGDAAAASGAFTLGDGAATFAYTDGPTRTSLSADLNNAPIAPIFALVGERATGRASGTLSASGNGALDAKIDMAVTDALFARRARDPLTMDLNGTITGGQLALDADVRSRNGLDASIKATAPVNARARPLLVALDGEGRAIWRAKGPADALWGLVGSLDQSVTGQVDGAGELRFAVGRLSGSGGLTLAQGGFADKLTGIDLRDVSARVTFDNDAARLVDFSARDARGGTVTATGRAQGLKDGQIDLVTRDVQLVNRPDARATGSGPLSLKWTTAGATLSGDLNIAEATLAPPRAAENIAELDVIEINRPVTLDVETKPTVVFPTTILDVRVRAPGRVFLRGRGLDSEWALDMRVGGTAAAPRVFGEARLVRGRFTLAGRPFEAERGLIRFNGNPEEALIDLVAEMSSPEITARVSLTGSVSDPEISLSSTPSLPEDEILPQALFGRAADDLSALEAAQLAASLAELAGRASLNIAGAARDLVGLDRLDVREETGVGLRVAGGKYLTRDVYLEVARTGIGETETQVEWRVRPQLFLISAFEPNGDRRLSVRWRREY